MPRQARKIAKRLQKRQDAYPGGTAESYSWNPPSGGGRMTMHRPGSQNRKK